MEGKRQKVLLRHILILLCFLFFGTGCGKEKAKDYEYEYTAMNIRVEEKDAIFMANLRDVVIYHGEHINCYFDKALSPELRDAYVETSEKVVQFLVDHIGFAGTLEVYAADGMYYYNPDSGKCALDTVYAGTSVQAALLVQAATGSATVNYGLLQAEGFSIARLLGWDISFVPPIASTNNQDIAHPFTGNRYEIMEVSPKEIKEENQFLLDLEYLCFSPNYVEEQQAEYAWGLAHSLSEYISENGRETEVLSLLMDCDDIPSFETRFTQLRNAWLEEAGSTVRISEKEHPVHYGNYGRFALFQMETLHGRWYVKGNLDTSFGGGGEYSWLFRQDYQETDMWVQQFERELANADEHLRDKTYDYPEVNFYIGEDDYLKSGTAAGYYNVESGAIYVGKLFSLVHEYCHYLMLQDGLFMEDGVYKEAYVTQLHLLPYYYGGYSEMVYLLFQELYKRTKEYHINEEGWEEYFREFEARFEGEVLICDKESFEEFMHFLIALEGMYTSLSEDVLSHTYGHQQEDEVILYSFAIYIANTYGEDVLYLIATGNDKVAELTGRTYEEFAKEWEGFLEKRYGFGKRR